ncbi:MAG TPA: ABC transporter permease [Candidatus Angelobacter sp.]|nr:ABC transporter permease [Candidatus Angelobacter sp.]
MAALKQPGALEALKVSLLSSFITVLLMAFLGIPLSYLLARADLPLKRLWISLVFLPMVVPDLAGGILLLQTFGPNGVIGQPLDARNVELTNNLAGIVLAQIFVAAPFVVVSAIAAFTSVDPKLELAAATLGDSRWQIFRRVSLPLAWPGIAAGLTLAWIRALGEFGSTLIMAYNPHTLPVYMWVKFESDGLTGALPVAFFLVVLAAAAVGVSMLFSRITGYADVVTPFGKAAGAGR